MGSMWGQLGSEVTVVEFGPDIVPTMDNEIPGRNPFTAGLDLDKIGVNTDNVGRIPVNERFATNVPGVYATGDVIPGPMLAYKAEEDGVACVELIAGKEGHVDYDMVKTFGIEYRVGKFPFLANSRAKAIDDAEGLVKIIADRERV
ncbi:hypothetical protein IFM89_035875 [Coptis chinensis]|uniref:FAD/NAD(P)-binding domain-containing protein n=1 Tax=Coptis chinensis TaxID=261450 RepID=A0A835LFH3_9MAGN|nr:hypothetical protein IFM89_035875 [Coptis chinensis]